MKAGRLTSIAVLVAVAALTLPALARADEVTNWNAIASETLVQFTGPGGGAPPALQINMAMVEGAVSDAVNAIERRHRPYLLHQKFSARGSLDAAAATAAYRVLTSLVLDPRSAVVAPQTKTALVQMLDAQLAASLGAVAGGSSKEAGIAAGDAAADAMIAARADDGRFGPSPWVLNPAPGFWQPLINPATLLPILDPTPWVGNVEPFTMQSSSQFRTAGPNSLTSEAWAREFNEVKALGSATSTTRTALQTQMALFWQSPGGPSLLWNPLARQLSAGLDTVDKARLFGFMNLAGADAAINCWNDKYYWNFWRPWNAIARAAEDGNPATASEAGWTALLTAPYPEHPSGHLCLDGAMLGALEMYFRADELEFDVTTRVTTPLPLLTNPRHFSSFSSVLDEITEARIWAGLHYRTADVQAKQLGREVAEWAGHHYFQVPG
jgi:hypothetical protein